MNKKILGIAAVIGVLYFATRKKPTATTANPQPSASNPTGPQSGNTLPVAQVQPGQNNIPTDSGQQNYYNPAPPASGGSSSGSSGTPWYGSIVGDLVSGAINAIPPITFGGGSSSGNSGSGTTASASSTTQGTGNIPKTGIPSNGIPTVLSTVAIAGPKGARTYHASMKNGIRTAGSLSFMQFSPGQTLGNIVGFNADNTGLFFSMDPSGSPFYFVKLDQLA